MNPDPPDDFEQSSIDVFDEILAEAQITPMVFEFPPEVIASIEAYETEHALNRDELLGAALERLGGRKEEFVEAMDRQLADPDNFVWPADDPLLCLLVAFAWIYASRWADKVRDTYGLRDEADDDEPADWWKTA